MKLQVNHLKVKPLFASLAALSLLLAVPAPSRASSTLIQAGTTTTPVPELLTDTATGQSGQTGLTGAAIGVKVPCGAGGVAGQITVSVKVPGTTATAAGQGSVAEEGFGNYNYFPAASETPLAGSTILFVHLTAPGVNVTDVFGQIIAPNLADGALLGLTNVATLSGQNGSAATLSAVNTQTSSATRQADMITALTQQGFTVTRSAKLDNLDVASSTRQPSGPVVVTTNNDKSGYSGVATNFVAAPTPTQNAAAITFPATFAANNLPMDYARNNAAPTWYTPASTGGSTGGVTDASVTADVSSAIGSANIPAATVAALFGAPFITIPGNHTTSGAQAILTYKQWMALVDALPGGDNASTAPVKSGTATTTYYLRGQPKTPAYEVAVSTNAYDAGGNQTGRSVLTMQPFPAVN